MTAPRIIVPGATTSITRRTTLRKAFLAPWDPLVPQVWLYSLADAQRNTGIAVHHAIAVVTHHHLTVTAQTANLPEFVWRFHHDTSCALNTVLAQGRYDAPRELFDGRSTHCMRLLDAPAQASQLVYERNNCVAAGLVSRPEHMPGYRFDFELWRTGYLDVPRPPVYFGDDRPEVIRLHVTPPPLLYAAFGGDIDRLVYHMRRSSEDAARTLRAAQRRQVLGARAVERLHPWSEPRTLREPGGRRIPTFRIGARGLLGKETAIAAAVETREFRAEHRSARLRCRDDHRAARFPYGTYAMRVRHGALVAPAAKPTALVAAPGPLLCDIQAELDAARIPSARGALLEGAVQLLDDVRMAIADEAPALCEHGELDFEHRMRALHDDKPEVVTRHRFQASTPHKDGAAPRRIVALRDRRRGRPPRKRQRHGSDPPG